MRHEIRRGGLYGAASGPKRHVRLPPSPGPGPLPWHTPSSRPPIHGNSLPRARTKGNSLSCKKNIHHPHQIPPRTASPKNKKALPEDRQGQQDLHVTTAVGDLNKRFWKGGGIGGRENLFRKKVLPPRPLPSKNFCWWDCARREGPVKKTGSPISEALYLGSMKICAF